MNRTSLFIIWICHGIPLLFLPTCFVAAQNIDAISTIKEIKLKSNLGSYRDSIYVLTGDEPFYQNYPSIKASLLKNIENGIQEGSYQGTDALRFGQWQAANLNLVFYQDFLYKATWYFKRGAATDVELLAGEIDKEFTKLYGKPEAEEFPEFTIMIWEGKKHRLQTFKEGSSEYSIEFRDLDLSDQVEAVQAK